MQKSDQEPVAARRSARLARDGGNARSDAPASASATFAALPRKRTLSSTTGAQKPAQKRARLSTTSADESRPKPKRSKGKLAKLPEMPLDILFDIFGNLHPMDLLRLARTTKALRAVLMNRSSRPVWKSAIASVPEFPACPSDMQEPKYVRLAFEPHCAYCLAPSVQNVEWHCRVRVCRRCFDGEDYFRTLPEAWNDLSIPEAVRHNLHKVLPCTTGYKLRGCIYFRTIHFKKLLAAFQSVEGDEAATRAFFEEREAAVAEIKRHAGECERWQAKIRGGHKDELDAIRQRRVQAILAKLRDLGYGRECDIYQPHTRYFIGPWVTFNKNPLVRQPKELTPRIWDKIRSTIIPLVEDIREARLADIRTKISGDRFILLRQLRTDYIEKRPRGTLVPPLPDMCDMPAFRAVIEKPFDEDAVEVAETDIVNADSFAEAFRALPALTKEWRAAALKSLLPLLPRAPAPGRAKRAKATATADPDADVARLDLATSLFACAMRQECRYVRRPLVFQAQHLLWHRCMTPYPYGAPEESERPRYQRIGRAPWNADGLQADYDVHAAEAAEALVKTCGLDPRTTTAEEMDNLDARFACSWRCCTTEDAQRAYNWRQAIAHRTYRNVKQYSLEYVNFVRLDRDQEALAQEIEREQPPLEDPSYADAEVFLCARCFDGDATYNAPALERHLSMRHAVRNDEILPDDYHVRPDWFATRGSPTGAAR